MIVRALSSGEKERVEKALNNFDELVNLKTSEELHQFAWFYNWDNDEDLKPLRWIIRNPLCDKGTALLIYWHSEPGYLYKHYANRDEVRAFDLQIYDLIKEIEERFLSNFYTQQNIRFDPHNDDGIDLTLDVEGLEIKQNIPDELLKATPGDIILAESFKAH